MNTANTPMGKKLASIQLPKSLQNPAALIFTGFACSIGISIPATLIIIGLAGADALEIWKIVLIEASLALFLCAFISGYLSIILEQKKSAQTMITERMLAGKFNTSEEGFLSSGDPLDELLLELSARVSEMLAGVNDHLSGISVNLEEATDLASDLSAENSHAIKALEKASVSIADLDVVCRNINDGAGGLLENSQAAGRLVDQSRDAMADSGKQAEQISQGNRNAVVEINNLSRTAGEIGEVSASISDIADHTRMIAFNAGIEAASAAEGSRRFGVVAREIRTLAEDVTKAVELISTKIAEIQKRGAELVISSEDWVKKNNLNIVFIDEAERKIDQVQELISAKTKAARELSTGATQLKYAADEIDRQLSVAVRSSSLTGDYAARTIKALDEIGMAISGIRSDLNVIKQG